MKNKLKLCILGIIKQLINGKLKFEQVIHYPRLVYTLEAFDRVVDSVTKDRKHLTWD